MIDTTARSGGSGRAEDATPGVNGIGTTCQRKSSSSSSSSSRRRRRDGEGPGGGRLLSPASKTPVRRLMLLVLLLLLGATQTVTAIDARAAEARGPSITVGLVLASFEALLFAFAVVVLSLTLVMFVRLYDALSPPTKTMLWVTAANVVLAALYLLFAGTKLFYLVQGQSVPQGEVLCRYLHPVSRTCQVAMWLGQPICAWVTLKTIRNQPLPPGRLRALTAASAAIAAVVFVLSEIYMPGKIILGSICAVPPAFAKQHSMYLEHFSVPFPLMDPRILHALVMVISLVVSLGYYIRAHHHLAAFKKRWRRNVQEARRKHLEAERIKNSHLRLAIEGGSDDAGSISVDGGGRRRSWSPFPLLSGGAAIQQEGDWYEEQEEGGLERKEGSDSKTSGVEREGSTGGESLQIEVEAERERRSCDDDEDWRRYSDAGASVYSDLSRDSDDPVSLVEMQKRTLAAQRAAVLVLMPPSPPTPPHQHQQHHTRDPEAAAAAAMEGGLGGRTCPDASRVEPDASAEAAAGSGEWAREEADREKAEELLHKASRTLVNRSLMLLGVYYLPSIFLFVVVANYRDGPPPLPVALVVVNLYNLSSPVLQSFVLVHLAVTVGHNILRFERSASTTAKAKAGKGPDVEEQERGSEEEEEQQQPGISPRRRRGGPGSSDADDDKGEGASPIKQQPGRPVHASPRRRPRGTGPSSRRSLAAAEGGAAASASFFSSDSPSRPLRALTTIYEVAFRARGPSTHAGSSRAAAGEEEEWGAEQEDEEDAHTRGGGTSAVESATAAVVQETLGFSLAKSSPPPSVSPAASASSSSGGSSGQQTRRPAAGAGAGGSDGLAPFHGGARGPSPTAALHYGLPRVIRSLFSPVHGGGGSGAGAGPYAGFQSEVSSLTDDQSYRSSVSWAPRSLSGRRLPPPVPSSGGERVLPGHVVAPVDAHVAAAPVAVARKEAAGGAAAGSGAGSEDAAPSSSGAAGAAAGEQSAAAVSVSTDGSVSSGGRSIVTESEWRAWREAKSV